MLTRSALVAALLATATPAAATPIIGGTEATDGEYPAVVLVDSSNALCTGELIDPNWIMTAAHCLDPAVLGLSSQAAVTSGTTVVLGTVNVGANRHLRQASETFVDPDWSKDHFGKHDLGLIHFDLAYTTDGSGAPVTPLAMDFKSKLAPIGITVTMVGFGETSTGSNATAGVEYELPGQTSVPCGNFHVGSGATIDDDDLLCFAQENGSGTCAGDSGGPLLATIAGQQEIVATTSFGDENCVIYGAYQRTSTEGSFIAAHIPALCSGSACVDPDAPADDGGCSTTGGSGSSVLIAVALLARTRGARRARRAGAARRASSPAA